MVSFARLFWWATMPVIKVFLMGLCGVVLAKEGVLASDGRRMLSRLVFLLFTPCLTFDKLAPVLSWANLVRWLPLPVNVAVSVAVGLALGMALRGLAPPWFRPHVVAATGLGNVGNLPLVLVAALVQEAGQSLGEDATVERGVAYVALGIVVANFSHFTIGIKLLGRRPDSEGQGTNGDPSDWVPALATDHRLPDNLVPDHADLAPDEAEGASGAAAAAAGAAAAAWKQERRIPRQHWDAGTTGDGAQGAKAEAPGGGDGDGAEHRSGGSRSAVTRPGDGEGRAAPVCATPGRPLPQAAASVQWEEEEDGGRPEERRALLPGAELRAAGADSGGCCGGSDGVISIGSSAGAAAARGAEVGALSIWVPCESAPPRANESSWKLPLAGGRAGLAGLKDPPASPMSWRQAGPPGGGEPGGRCRAPPRGAAAAARRCMAASWELASPPLVASAAALAVGLAPPARELLVGPGAKLELFRDVISMFGDCCIPGLMLVVGATLERGPGSARLPMRVVAAVTAARLVLLPLLGVSWVLLARWLGLLPSGTPRLLVLVMLITNGVPTALNMHTLCTMNSNHEAEMGVLIFYEYVSSLVTVPLFLALFLHICQEYF